MSYEKHYGIYDSAQNIWWQVGERVWVTTSEAVAHAQCQCVYQGTHEVRKENARLCNWQVVCIETWHREREEERLRQEQEIAPVKLEEHDGSTS